MTNTTARKEIVGEVLPAEVRKCGHKGKMDVCPKHIYLTGKKKKILKEGQQQGVHSGQMFSIK